MALGGDVASMELLVMGAPFSVMVMVDFYLAVEHNELVHMMSVVEIFWLSGCGLEDMVASHRTGMVFQGAGVSKNWGQCKSARVRMMQVEVVDR